MSEQARVETAERKALVIGLRQAGLDFEQIAQRTGYADSSGAWRAWQAAMADVVRQPAREAFDLELSRLDVAQTALWAKVRAGNLGAVREFLNISRERRKMLGLDAAFRIDVSSDDARAEVRDAVTELLGILGEDGPPL
jgi:hypothetical protein